MAAAAPPPPPPGNGGIGGTVHRTLTDVGDDMDFLDFDMAYARLLTPAIRRSLTARDRETLHRQWDERARAVRYPADFHTNRPVSVYVESSRGAAGNRKRTSLLRDEAERFFADAIPALRLARLQRAQRDQLRYAQQLQIIVQPAAPIAAVRPDAAPAADADVAEVEDDDDADMDAEHSS